MSLFKNFMQEALKEANKAFLEDEVPVGAVLVHKNTIIARGYNEMRKRRDPLAHAEILVIKKGQEILESNFLQDCNLYVTLEPCNFCAAALSLIRISKIYWGASDEKFGAIESNSALYSGKKGLFHIPEQYGPMSHEACSKIMKDFFLRRRGGA